MDVALSSAGLFNAILCHFSPVYNRYNILGCQRRLLDLSIRTNLLLLVIAFSCITSLLFIKKITACQQLHNFSSLVYSIIHYNCFGNGIQESRGVHVHCLHKFVLFILLSWKNKFLSIAKIFRQWIPGHWICWHNFNFTGTEFYLVLGRFA